MGLSVRRADIIILAVFALAVFLSFFRLRSGKSSSPRLIIMSGGTEMVYSMRSDGTYRVPGALGESVIQVRDGKAFFEDSPCPNKTCVQGGPVFRANDWRACLPNDVFIRIEGGPGELDATSF
ncbi:MAG: NusG domain II-containing protein [Treponema sp.]|nr:NusG domain II-containing protein [Treponema sp.]